MADIIVNHFYILFLRSRKTNTKRYNKKQKKPVARNIIASKKYIFLIFVVLDIKSRGIRDYDYIRDL